MANKTCGDCVHCAAQTVIASCKHNGVVADMAPACAKFEPKPLTNSDVIRKTMTTSDLIDVIKCPHPDKDCIHRNMQGYACRCCKRDWLNAPAESDGKDE